MIARIVAALVALVLLVAGLLAAVEIALAQLGRPPLLVPHEEWAAWLRAQTWQTSPVRLLLLALAVLGLVLLLAALRRGRPSGLSLPPREGRTPDGVRVTASRRSVEQLLAGAARRVGGVRRARVRLTRRRADVRVATLTRSDPELRDTLAGAVTERLGHLGLDRVRPRVQVREQG